MNIEISSDTKALIKAALAADGSSGDASEYIRSLVLEDQLTRETLTQSLNSDSMALEKLAIEGLESGAPEDATSFYWQDRRRKITDRFPSV